MTEKKFMTRTTRYVQNHNNLTVSLGIITEQDREKLRKINIPKKGRSYIVLTYAKMKLGQYITYEEVAQLNPQRFLVPTDGPKRRKEIITTLYKYNLIEQNPQNPEQFRITPLGVKFLYAKPLLRKRNH